MIRDAAAVAAATRVPYEGYARSGITLRPFLARVLACCTILGTMVGSGIALGSLPADGGERARR